MKSNLEFFELTHNKKAYKINIDKILTILSALENKKIRLKNKNKIFNLMKKYGLFDSIFLENVNKL